MKKIFFYIVILIITSLFIEFGSWSIIKVYQSIYQPKKNTNFQRVNLKNESRRDYHVYHAFYGWKKNDITSEDINVKNNLRKTKKNPNWNLKSKIWFFGGSTMWGSSVSDKNTIPSLSSDLNHTFQPINFGEDGYNSGQSLNRLIEINDEINEGDHVVFFDGVNDSYANCSNLNGPNGTEQVRHIRRLISKDKNFLKGLYIEGITKFKKTNSFLLLNAIGKRIGLEDDLFKHYSCNQPEYAFKVAENLVRHWKIAEIITKNKKASFTCILQPNPYTATFKVNQNIRKIYKQATLDVYPKIKKLAESLECYRDLTNLFEEDYYIDECCHVSDVGNKIIAQKIMNILFKNES